MVDEQRASPVEILLVEDNPGDVRLTEEALKESKVLNNLHVAEDGVEALEFLRKEGRHSDAPHPDLILLDLNLPKKDGREDPLDALRYDCIMWRWADDSTVDRRKYQPRATPRSRKVRVGGSKARSF